MFDHYKERANSRDIDNSIICWNCNGKGHFARDCRNKRNFNNNRVPTSPYPSRQSEHRANVIQYCNNLGSDVESNHDELIYQTVHISGERVDALVDSGSELSLIDYGLCCRLGLTIEQYDGRSVRAVNGHDVNIIGKVKLNVGLSFTNKVKFTPIIALVIEDFDFPL